MLVLKRETCTRTQSQMYKNKESAKKSANEQKRRRGCKEGQCALSGSTKILVSKIG